MNWDSWMPTSKQRLLTHMLDKHHLDPEGEVPSKRVLSLMHGKENCSWTSTRPEVRHG